MKVENILNYCCGCCKICSKGCKVFNALMMGFKSVVGGCIGVSNCVFCVSSGGAFCCYFSFWAYVSLSVGLVVSGVE